jgi:hypothetical protein
MLGVFYILSNLKTNSISFGVKFVSTSLDFKKKSKRSKNYQNDS